MRLGRTIDSKKQESLRLCTAESRICSKKRPREHMHRRTASPPPCKEQDELIFALISCARKK